MYGAVRLQKACKKFGLKPLIGCTLQVDDVVISVVARNQDGYASMNRLLTHLHNAEVPILANWEYVQTLQHCVVLFPTILPITLHSSCRYVVALDAQRKPGETRMNRLLNQRAQQAGLDVCIAPDVRYAYPEAYRTYDVLTCTRLGITVFDPHIERPVNDQQHLKSESELRCLLPYSKAFETTHHIINECSFDLLPGYVTPPAAKLPPNINANDALAEACINALPKRYAAAATETLRAKVKKLLSHELSVIADLGLSDFFLVVQEIVHEARRRGIRCSGRGSAANSIVAYLLGITHVCPIQHNLLFERFLHKGRKGTPDIDVDFDSDRRHEIIEWMERRFGREQTAMTATIITYRARMAVRDAAKALGWPMDIINKMTKAIPGYTNRPLHEYYTDLAAIVGDAPLLQTMVDIATDLLNRPRHLGLHSGGMILSAKPLTMFTPLQRSANGVGVVQFDKDDIEAMGLVKFDVLGLRMLACISEAVELIKNNTSDEQHPRQLEVLEHPVYNDPHVMDLIRSGRTLGLFQIESQGQMHLLAQHQPECFNDLITEVALFRPGPLQGGMVHPYIRRRRGEEPVTYLHPLLEPILEDTLGIVLYQEQVLEIAHHFAGMPLEVADDFRALISKNRDAQEMASMREGFVKGAVARGVEESVAIRVYETVSHFVGYGFCRSHAAAFARIVYQSAWLKTYYPAAYLAAFMQHRPGFYNLMTLEEEARRFKVPVLLPDINISGVRYNIEKNSSGVWCIRKPLTSITNVTTDIAQAIVWERASGAFSSIEDVWIRTKLNANILDSLALSGACDSIEGNARKGLWKSGILSMRTATADEANTSLQFVIPADSRMLTPTIDDVPELPPIRAQERLAYDYTTHGAARVHPMTLYRRALNSLDILPIASLRTFSPVHHTTIRTAGIVILRQSPPTAHGVLFITIEDETGFVQCVVEPNEREYFRDVLRNAALVVRGVVYARGNWRGIVIRDVTVLHNVIGGYHGHPAMYGGTDTQELHINDVKELNIHPER